MAWNELIQQRLSSQSWHGCWQIQCTGQCFVRLANDRYFKATGAVYFECYIRKAYMLVDCLTF